MNNPSEVLELNMNGAIKKTSHPFFKLLVLAMMSGAFIAFGAVASSFAAHNIKNVGVAKLVAGCIFPVGLMLVIIVGAELFTGNCLISMAVFDKRVSVGKMIYNLVVVYFGNMIGGVLVAALTYAAGQWNQGSNLVGAYTIKVAVGKTGLSFTQCVASGILCNVLVCLAVLAAAASKDVTGKTLMSFFIILAFVISGFEHCVANMYYLFAGKIAASNTAYVNAAIDAYGLTADKITNALSLGKIFINNLLPVTIGNILGGMVFTGLPFWFVNKKKKEN